MVAMNSPRLDSLRVRQLRFLGLLATQGSLAATAEQLSMSPSAASMMLKEIEGLFGTKLFRRQGRGMAPTEAGRALLPRCRTVLGEIGAMGSSLHDTTRPLLRIGAFPHTATTVLPSLVGRLLKASPPWRLQLVDGNADHLLDLLMRGEIDLMVGRVPRMAVGMPALEGLEQQVLYEGGLAVVASRRHPLARRRTLALGDLLAWPWILPGPQSTTRVAVVDAYLRRGLVPPLPVVESPSFHYSLSVVAQTELLSCCAHSAAVGQPDNIALLPVDLGVAPAPVALIWRRHASQATQAVAALQ